MSGEKSRTSRSRARDRRARRTRKAVVETFSALVQSRPYEDIRITELTGKADVGRSTFYEHYRGKDDVLVESMVRILATLADAPFEPDEPDRLELVFRHFGEKRRLAGRLFSGGPNRQSAARIARALAIQIERRLVARLEQRGATPAIPAPLIAAQAARSELALINAWLVSADDCSPKDAAAAFRRGMRALVEALSGATPGTARGTGGGRVSPRRECGRPPRGRRGRDPRRRAG